MFFLHFTESISMIDPVIDEHFRRSLGADYAILFGNKKPGAAVKPTPIVGAKKPSLIVSQQFSVASAASAAASASTLHSPIAVATVLPTTATSLVNAAVTSPSSRISTSPSTSAAIVVKVEPQPARQPPPSVERRTSDATDEDSAAVSMSVDDHFAKALGGDTWKQLKRAESRSDDALC